MDKETKYMTICFLLRRYRNGNTEVCLGKKKRGYRMGKLNGAGGKIEVGETPMACALRETYEEFGVNLNSITYSGEVIYEEIDKIHHCHIFTSDAWTGTPSETDEMKPDWYNIENIPFNRMGETDPLWITEVVKGKYVMAKFCFDTEGYLLSKKVKFQ